MRILIGIVGYRNLSDLSVGHNLMAELQALEWEPGVEIEDLSFGPIAVVQNLEARPAYDRMIFLSATQRGRAPGRIYRSEYRQELPSDEEIQGRIVEAVTGVVDLDNLLVIAQHFRVLAEEVIIVEIEPIEVEFAEKCSDAVVALGPEILEIVRAEAYGTSHSARAR